MAAPRRRHRQAGHGGRRLNEQATEADLGPKARHALAFLRQAGGWVPTAAVAAHINSQDRGPANVLGRLLEAGFVTSRVRYGRAHLPSVWAYEWQATSKRAPA